MSGKLELRPTVQWFAEHMELKLRANDHKDGWSDERIRSLMKRLYGEAWELSLVLERCQADTIHESLDPRIIAEAADVANFAMMVADNARRQGGKAR